MEEHFSQLKDCLCANYGQLMKQINSHEYQSNSGYNETITAVRTL